jgi:hypothetical protein
MQHLRTLALALLLPSTLAVAACGAGEKPSAVADPQLTSDAAACPAKEEVRAEVACSTEGLACPSVERAFPDECHRPANADNPEIGCSCVSGKWQCIKYAIYCNPEAGPGPCTDHTKVYRGAPCTSPGLTCGSSMSEYPDECHVSPETNYAINCTCGTDNRWECSQLPCPGTGLDRDAGDQAD